MGHHFWDTSDPSTCLPSIYVNSSQVKIKYVFSKPFRSKHFSKDGNHAESEQFL